MSSRISVDASNRYFCLNGRPVFLLGARDMEQPANCLNYPFKEKVAAAAQYGVNHWRVEMQVATSSYPTWRDPVSKEQIRIAPFARTSDGAYNLDEWNEEYFGRLRDFVQLCCSHGIVVTLELWGTYSYMWGPGWETNPFNPANNVNLTAEDLPVGHPNEGWDNRYAHPFFHSVPQLQHKPRLLQYQRAFVQRLLEATWEYGNVLYVCGNEELFAAQFVRYWADFVHAFGRECGATLLYGRMPEQAVLPEVYHDYSYLDFIDISQSLHIWPEGYWWVHNQGLVHIIRHTLQCTQDPAIPLINLKNYSGKEAGLTQGLRRRSLWLRFMAGMAMSSFHRVYSANDEDAEKAQALLSSNLQLIREFAGFFAEGSVNWANMAYDTQTVLRAPGADCIARSRPGEEYLFFIGLTGQGKQAGNKPGVLNLPAGSYELRPYRHAAGEFGEASLVQSAGGPTLVTFPPCNEEMLVHMRRR